MPATIARNVRRYAVAALQAVALVSSSALLLSGSVGSCPPAVTTASTCAPFNLKSTLLTDDLKLPANAIDKASGLYYRKETNALYVIDKGTQGLKAIDLATASVSTVIASGLVTDHLGTPSRMVGHGNTVYVCEQLVPSTTDKDLVYDSARIKVIDLDNKQVTQTFEIPNSKGAGSAYNVSSMCLGPGENTVLYSMGHDIYQIDPSTGVSSNIYHDSALDTKILAYSPKMNAICVQFPATPTQVTIKTLGSSADPQLIDLGGSNLLTFAAADPSSNDVYVVGGTGTGNANVSKLDLAAKTAIQYGSEATPGPLTNAGALVIGATTDTLYKIGFPNGDAVHPAVFVLHLTPNNCATTPACVPLTPDTAAVSLLADNVGVTPNPSGGRPAIYLESLAGLAKDSSGNFYAADPFGRKIYKITADGVVSTYAGTGVSGSQDGPALQASFTSPQGIAFDKDGTLYVADHSRVRKISTQGQVTTLTTALQGDFGGLALDVLGNVYVTNHFLSLSFGVGSISRIERISPQGQMTPLPGGDLADPANVAKLDLAYGIGLAFDKSGNLYMTCQGNGNVVCKLTPSGQLTKFTTVANPTGVAVDDSGNLYVSSIFENRIYKVTPDGKATPLAGEGVTKSGNLATDMAQPGGLVVDSCGGTIHVLSPYAGRLLKIATKAPATTSNCMTLTVVNGADCDFSGTVSASAPDLGVQSQVASVAAHALTSSSAVGPAYPGTSITVNVTLGKASKDAGWIYSPSSFTLNADNWGQPQTVTLYNKSCSGSAKISSLRPGGSFLGLPFSAEALHLPSLWPAQYGAVPQQQS